MYKPKKLDKFMEALVDSASQYSFVNYLDNRGITNKELIEIINWFYEELGIKI